MNKARALTDRKPKARLRIGASGYSYTEWVEAGFYPPGTQPGKMLPLYARRFSAVEVNQTWYQLPRADAVERMRQQAPPDFRFAVKLPRDLTDEPLPENWRELTEAFRNGVAPLSQSGQLAAVLLQFPPAFDRSVANRRHLAHLLDELADLPLVVEFRQGSWNQERVFNELARRRVTLAAVDEPDLPGLFPALNLVTNPALFYVRFHGRNAKGWRLAKKPLQFDYNYWEDELREWMEKRIAVMAGQAERGLIFFTNYVRAQSAQNAEILIRLAREYGFELG